MEDGDKEERRDERDLGDKLNELLDKPVFDLSTSDDNEPKLLRDFKELIENDYQFAEALYAGAYFSILIFFAQQGVRIYKNCYFMPDKMCPWEVAPLVDTLIGL